MTRSTGIMDQRLATFRRASRCFLGETIVSCLRVRRERGLTKKRGHQDRWRQKTLSRGKTRKFVKDNS